ncbi:MAG TPA: glutathione S-transferase N-terminal domain-containing protein, partial [Phenylobacterium sp.]|nr:glutathione S-transferase N-terminal domain-containing protein [Phenylobacterium sp.]
MTYRIFGSEMSPYSVKVRAYFRFKGLPHEWVPRRAENDEDYKRYARLPIVPTVATPTGEGLQDSTPIMETVEAQHPEPSIHPDDPALAFLSALIEEFGDEWGNKLMFHHRWWAEVDQQASAQTLAAGGGSGCGGGGGGVATRGAGGSVAEGGVGGAGISAPATVHG